MDPKKKRGRKPSPDSKRAQGVDRHTKPRKCFHADEDLFEVMEAYRVNTKPRATDTEILITALEEFLERKGYWPKGTKPDGK